MTMITRLLAAVFIAVVAATALPVAAQDAGLKLDSVVELEKSTTAADGTVSTNYEKPEVVVPGDRIRITLRYHNQGREPVTNLKLRNPIPDGLMFDGTPDVAGFSASVDGGSNWGALADLTLTTSDGTSRSATSADVTHVMWVLPQPVAPGARGSVAFFTRVR
jgi:uncharacterized repeat protein (TIGR01451 family)